MKQDEIIEMTRQAGGFSPTPEFLEAFAKLVAAKEREEIAQFLERTELGSLPDETALQYARLLKAFATLIRARGEA